MVLTVLSYHDSLDVLYSCQKFIGAFCTSLKQPPPLLSSACSNYSSSFKFSFGVWAAAVLKPDLLVLSSLLQISSLLTLFFFTGTCVLHSYVPTFAPCNHPLCFRYYSLFLFQCNYLFLGLLYTNIMLDAVGNSDVMPKTISFF